jgi:hypothetical protein
MHECATDVDGISRDEALTLIATIAEMARDTLAETADQERSKAYLTNADQLEAKGLTEHAAILRDAAKRV